MLTLRQDEKDTIRLLTGVETTAVGLTDNQIDSEAILGQAAAYVFRKVIQNVDVGKLTHYADMQALRNETDLNEFLQGGSRGELSAVQTASFRRAVLLRCAGLAMLLLKPPVILESANEIISQRRESRSWQEVQAQLFERADTEIDTILTHDPDDAFSRVEQFLFGVV